ncbi:ArsR/SmtB family transcription factor [Myroides sp. LJL116]
MLKRDLTEKQIEIARITKALSHPIRVAILEMLASQECCFHGDMSEVLPVAKSTLSQHLKELREAGLIQGTINLPTVKYCINKENWRIAKQLLNEFFEDIKKPSECS